MDSPERREILGMMVGGDDEKRVLGGMLERAGFWRPLHGLLKEVHAIFEETPNTDWVGKPKLELSRDETPSTLVIEVCAQGDVDASRLAYTRCVKVLMRRLDEAPHGLDVTLLVSMT